MSVFHRVTFCVIIFAFFGYSAEVMEYKLSDGRILVGEKQGDTIIVSMGKSKIGVRLSPGISVVEENPVKNIEPNNSKIDEEQTKTKQEQKQDEINDLLGKNKGIEHYCPTISPEMTAAYRYGLLDSLVFRTETVNLPAFSRNTSDSKPERFPKG